MKYHGFEFEVVGELRLETDAAGRPLEKDPASRFENKSEKTLHADGHGPFCEFRLARKSKDEGVYLFVEAGQIRYVGETTDLARRFDSGYGHISPRNCFVGGRSTNCRINKRVLEIYRSGGKIKVLFLPTKDRKAVEKQLIEAANQGETKTWNLKDNR